jgi:glycosyltransferase involved in cell wall biosynthesis
MNHYMRSAAIVVTHNRLALLKENLNALRGQTRMPDEIIVVNNGSTDGTAEWLKSQPGLTVVPQENLGSSGGQFTGIKTAYARGHDWFWCMDDDVVPKPDALEQLLNCARASDERTGFLCSVVRWTDGGINLMTAPNVFSGPAQEALPENLVRVVSASFVAPWPKKGCHSARCSCGMTMRNTPGASPINFRPIRF